eukprot:365417-Chlamydomonas_euryale.AAC.10
MRGGALCAPGCTPLLLASPPPHGSSDFAHPATCCRASPTLRVVHTHPAYPGAVLSLSGSATGRLASAAAAPARQLPRSSAAADAALPPAVRAACWPSRA